MDRPVIGYALTGSFCTFRQSIAQMQLLLDSGYHVLPLMSFHAAAIDTRFGRAEDFVHELEARTNRKVIQTIADAEPIGPKQLCDLLVVSPCTGNTLGKLAAGIYDTPVTLAVKSQLRAERPVLLGVSTNDALSGSARALGTLLPVRHLFFLPLRQDAPAGKPRSMVCLFEQTLPAVKAALEGRQLTPIVC